MQAKLVSVFCLILFCSLVSWETLDNSGNHEKTALAATRIWVADEIGEIHNALMDIVLSKDIVRAKQFYHKARRHYKHIEFFIEYVSPREAKYQINGPLVPKHDPETGNVLLRPNGFQRIEEILFSDLYLKNKPDLIKEIKALDEQLQFLKEYYSGILFEDGIILEMLQLQLFRIAALNLNGYDATITHTNIQEAAWNMEGVGKTIHFFKYYCKSSETRSVFKQLSGIIEKTSSHLKANQDYEAFRRLEFITKFINPLNVELVKFHNASGLSWNSQKQALNLRSGYLFGRESFNVRYFSIYYNDTSHLIEQAELGKMLFSDPILSGNQEVSCAGCHNPDLSFTDGKVKSMTIDGGGFTDRNSPSLLNVIFQKAFFYDGRAYQLEQQITDVIHNPVEMHGNFSDIIDRLRTNANYRSKFSKAFAGTPDSAITDYAIQKSLTEYEKTIISFESRFDNYLRGNIKDLNSEEINGYDVFAGKALCGSCHFFPLFNGTVPPSYNDSEFEVIGTSQNSDNKNQDTDKGRFLVTGIEEHMFAFKTPSLRNVELTSPYMHNGVYRDLEDVIEFYGKGGGAGLGFKITNQTLPFDSLKLTRIEKNNLIGFLKSLTDNAILNNKP